MMNLSQTAKVIAGSLTDATSKAVLGTSYADVGSKLSLNAWSGIQLFADEIDNSEAGTLSFYVSPEHAQPTANSAMFSLADADGTLKEVVVTQNGARAYELPVSAKWIQTQGKSTSGAAAVSAFLSGNTVFAHGSPVSSEKKIIAGTAVALTGDNAVIGNIIDIRGLGNLTLFVDNSTGTGAATLNVYTDITSTSTPANQTNMRVLASDAGTAKAFVTADGGKAAHFLGNLSGNFIGIQGTGVNAAVAISLLGTPNGINVE